MTREEIIRMAHEAGIGPIYGADDESLERFAALVAAHEREECAHIMDRNAKVCNTSSMLSDVLHGAAAAIRARGQK